MRALVISDSHGNITNLREVMSIAKKSNIEAIIHCGDWENEKAVDTVLSFGILVYGVLGNADVRPEVGKSLSVNAKRFDENFLELDLGGKRIGITHKPNDIKKYFGGKKLDVIFCGHRHSKDESVIDGKRVVRPGALIRGVNFAVYDTLSDKINFIEDE